MQSFTRQIKKKIGVADFTFIRVFTPTGIRYFVRVVDNMLKPYLFSMEYINERWKIINAPKVPTWILKMEVELEKAIKENATK